MTRLDNKNLMLFSCEVLKVFGIYPEDFTDAEILEIGMRVERLYQIYEHEAERDARELQNQRQSVE